MDSLVNDPSYVIGRKRLDAASDPEIVVAVEGLNAQQVIRFQNGVWTNAAASPKIHIYDDRFVTENVLIGHHINVDQRRNLYGLVIGAQGIALKQNVDSAEVTLRNCGDSARDAETKVKGFLPHGQTVESFRNIPKVADVDQQINSAKEMLAAASQTKSKAESIRQRPALPLVPIAKLPTNLTDILASTLDETALVAEQKIREHLHAHSDSLDLHWLGHGLKAKTGSGCPFCGQSMDGLEILRAYNAFFAGQLQAEEMTRRTLIKATHQSFGEEAKSRIRETFTLHETECTWWNDVAGFALNLRIVPEVSDILAVHDAAHRAIIEALSRKQANPANPTTLTLVEQQAFEEWELTSAALVEYNSGIVNINETLTQLKSDAGNIDLMPLQQSVTFLEASKKRHQTEVIEAYAAYEKALHEKVAAQSQKDAANNALRDQTNTLLAQYGNRINDLLDLFAANFRIVCGGSNENYVSFSGGQPSGQLAVEILGRKIASSPGDAADPGRPSLANTISGGDRSALALAFFLAQVEQKPDLAESVIVFDDPFHSQDRSRQNRTIERIHALARQAKQCFVFSHDLDFARAVSPIHGVRARTFLLDPLTDHTYLESKELPMLPSRAYEAKYQELTAFIANPANYSNQLHTIAGTLRTILEEYLQLKFPLRWTGQDYWFGTMIGEIRCATGDDPLIRCQGIVGGLTEVNEYSQRFHHRTTGATADVPDARELVTYAKQALSIIHQ